MPVARDRIVKIGRAVIAVLAVVGGLEVSSQFLSWVLSSIDDMLPSDATVAGSIVSPDGNHKAVVFMRDRGGGFSPFCFEYVAVLPIREADKTAYRQSYRVLFSDCGGLGETLEEMKSSVSWTSSEELQIALDINRGTSRGDEVNLNGYADGLKVRVTYVVRPRP
jgi:hypothetical protein